MTIQIEIVRGKDISNYTNFISELRIDVFSDFPYLYKGKLEYEKKYMKAYEINPHSTIAIAKNNNEIAAISTGIPLRSEADILSGSKTLFDKLNVDINKIYYYGEIITVSKFRGNKLAEKLLKMQDAFIKQEWNYSHSSILTVVRQDEHPLKPENYKSSDGVWNKIGFVKTGIRVKFNWPTIQANGSVKDDDNLLEFWLKPI